MGGLGQLRHAAVHLRAEAGNELAENGNGPDTTIAALGAGTVLPVGLSGEGAAITDSPSTQLTVAGLLDEYIIPIPVPAGAGSPVSQLGLQSGPAAVTVSINAQYTATDEHAI